MTSQPVEPHMNIYNQLLAELEEAERKCENKAKVFRFSAGGQVKDRPEDQELDDLARELELALAIDSTPVHRLEDYDDDGLHHYMIAFGSRLTLEQRKAVADRIAKQPRLKLLDLLLEGVLPPLASFPRYGRCDFFDMLPLELRDSIYDYVYSEPGVTIDIIMRKDYEKQRRTSFLHLPFWYYRHPGPHHRLLVSKRWMREAMQWTVKFKRYISYSMEAATMFLSDANIKEYLTHIRITLIPPESSGVERKILPYAMTAVSSCKQLKHVSIVVDVDASGLSRGLPRNGEVVVNELPTAQADNVCAHLLAIAPHTERLELELWDMYTVDAKKKEAGARDLADSLFLTTRPWALSNAAEAIERRIAEQGSGICTESKAAQLQEQAPVYVDIRHNCRGDNSRILVILKAIQRIRFT